MRPTASGEHCSDVPPEPGAGAVEPHYQAVHIMLAPVRYNLHGSVVTTECQVEYLLNVKLQLCSLGVHSCWVPQMPSRSSRG